MNVTNRIDKLFNNPFINQTCETSHNHISMRLFLLNHLSTHTNNQSKWKNWFDLVEFGWELTFNVETIKKQTKIKWKTIEITIQLLVLYCIQVVWKVIFDFDLYSFDWLIDVHLSFDRFSFNQNQNKSNWWEMIEMIKTIKGNWDLRRRSDWEFIWFDLIVWMNKCFDFASNLFELRNQPTNQLDW